MREIRLGLMDKLDVKVYANDRFCAEQMEQIRLGMMDKVDVKKYATPSLSEGKMEIIREALKLGLDTEVLLWGVTYERLDER